MSYIKGNWIYKEQMVYSESDDSGKTIANCNTEANARLIAAAPDLLDACEDSLTMLKEVLSQYMEHNADGSRIKIPLERKLEIAIAKTKS